VYCRRGQAENHVWTAPLGQGFLRRDRKVSGAVMSSACWRGMHRSAGPDEKVRLVPSPHHINALNFGACSQSGFQNLSVASHHSLSHPRSCSPCGETSSRQALCGRQAATGRSS
jgi:hypothetical protein